MAILWYYIRVKDEEIGRFGVNATSTPECSIWQQVAAAVANSGVAVSDKTEIEIHNTEDSSEPWNTLQWNTIKRKVRACEDEVFA